MNLLDRGQIRVLFEELSEELARRGTRAEVFLVGGAIAPKVQFLLEEFFGAA